MSSRERSKPYQTILLAGLIAGVLDLTAAVVTTSLRGREPMRMLQSIASGLLGLDSYNGGLKTAALGVVLHFVIATGAAAVFYAASRKLTFLVRQAIVAGLLYGIAVYFFMNLVVLPLSAFPHKVSFTLSSLVTGLIVHMLCVGLPISLTVRRYSYRKTRGWGDGEARRHGEGEIRRQGDTEIKQFRRVSQSPSLPVSESPRLPVSQSHLPLVLTVSPDDLHTASGKSV